MHRRRWEQGGKLLRGGARDEVRAVAGKALSATAAKTLGLPQILQHLRNGASGTAQLEADIRLATRQYAKRQRTWLRREDWLTPLEADAAATPAGLAKRIAQQL